MFTDTKNLCNTFHHPGNPVPGVIYLKEDRKEANVRLDPEKRICPMFDSVSIKKFPAPDREEMGVRVLDNYAEEHMM